MSDHKEGRSANEPGNSNGVELCRGAQRIAREDLLRSKWLDSKVDAYVRQARRRRQMMRVVRETT
jgi:hypothetical protein